MLTDSHTLLHIKKVAMTSEERKKDERSPVFAVRLGLEPLTYDQAKQLGPRVLDQCFDTKRQIREGMDAATIELDEDEQCLIARMATDASPHATLRQVRISKITVTKRDTSDSGHKTKTKKIGPQQATLHAEFHCLVDHAEKVHRDFLCLNFGASLFFSFEPEQANLFTGLHTDDGDGDGDDDPRIPGMDDDEVGDVLEEQAAAKPKRGRKPKLVKG